MHIHLLDVACLSQPMIMVGVIGPHPLVLVGLLWTWRAPDWSVAVVVMPEAAGCIREAFTKEVVAMKLHITQVSVTTYIKETRPRQSCSQATRLLCQLARIGVSKNDWNMLRKRLLDRVPLAVTALVHGALKGDATIHVQLTEYDEPNLVGELHAVGRQHVWNRPDVPALHWTLHK